MPPLEKGHLSSACSRPPLPLAQTSLCYHAVPSPLEIVTLGGSRLLWQHWRKLLRCTNVDGGVVVEETEEREERVVKKERQLEVRGHRNLKLTNLKPTNSEESVRMIGKKAKRFQPGDPNLILRFYRRDESISRAGPRLAQNHEEAFCLFHLVDRKAGSAAAPQDGLWAPRCRRLVHLRVYFNVKMPEKTSEDEKKGQNK